MLSALEKAAILVEALPYIQKYRGKTVVIKYGGHAMLNEDLKQKVMQDVILMHYVGINPVVVHGGGPEITTMLNRLGVESRFVNGLRVTDPATMEVVEMVLNKVNKDVVAHIQSLGGRAVGLSGRDGGLMLARKQWAVVRDEQGQESLADLGHVGEVERVDPDPVKVLMERGYIPVVSPVGGGPNGESFNINADTAAGALAAALRAAKLMLLTDVEGILADPGDKSSVISHTTLADIPELVRKGVISGGMLPKVDCCIQALHAGAGSTNIIDGRIPHAILLEFFTDKGIGTLISP